MDGIKYYDTKQKLSKEKKTLILHIIRTYNLHKSLKGYSKMRKGDLVDFLWGKKHLWNDKKNVIDKSLNTKKDLTKLTKKKILNIVRKYNHLFKLKGYSKMRKADLVDFLWGKKHLWNKKKGANIKLEIKEIKKEPKKEPKPKKPKKLAKKIILEPKKKEIKGGVKKIEEDKTLDKKLESLENLLEMTYENKFEDEPVFFTNKALGSLVMYDYILKKHKKDCIVISDKIHFLSGTEMQKHHVKSSTTSKMEIMIVGNKNIGKITSIPARSVDDFFKNVKKCAETSPLVACLLTMVRSTGKNWNSGHANMLIFHHFKDNNYVERFEPHGSRTGMKGVSTKKLDKSLTDFFKKGGYKYINPGFSFMKTTKGSPIDTGEKNRKGVQNFTSTKGREITFMNKFKFKEVGGYCVAIAYLLLDLRFTYPNERYLHNKLVTLLNRDPKKIQSFLWGYLKFQQVEMDKVIKKIYNTPATEAGYDDVLLTLNGSFRENFNKEWNKAGKLENKLCIKRWIELNKEYKENREKVEKVENYLYGQMLKYSNNYAGSTTKKVTQIINTLDGSGKKSSDSIRPLFCRMGNKYFMRNDILPYIPPHKKYVEAFVGSGAIFFLKEKAEQNVLNDIDKNVIKMYKLAKKKLNYDNYVPFKSLEEVRRFYEKEPHTSEDKLLKLIIQYCNTYAGKGTGKIYKDTTHKFKLDKIDVYRNKLKDVKIESKDYKEILKKNDGKDTFFYLDPPYESSKGLYKKHGMDYEEMNNILKTLKGKFLMSMNDSPNVRKIFNTFHQKKVNVEGHGHAQSDIGSGTRKELLISNYPLIKHKLEGSGYNKYSRDTLYKAANKAFGKEHGKLPNDITKEELLELIEEYEIYQENMMDEKRLRGSGFFGRFARFITQKAFNIGKAISAPIRYIAKKHPLVKVAAKLLEPRLNRYSNTSQKTLTEYGNNKITKISLVKTPVNEKLMGVLNTISYGKWRELMKEYGFDKMYHLGMVCTLDNGKKVIVEKNEEINVNTKWDENINKNTDYMPVELRGQILSINEMLIKTRKSMGDMNFFDYDAFTNNCQIFIQKILTINTLITQELNGFLFQDVSGLSKKLPKYVGVVAKGATRLGNIFSKLIGHGALDMREIPDNFSEEVNDIFESLIFKNGKLTLLGSMVFKSALYAGDYDLYEIVNVSSLKSLKKQFQAIIKQLLTMDNVIIDDIKLGSVEKWRVFDECNLFYANKSRMYNKDEFKSKINALYKEKVINKTEQKEALNLLVHNPSYNELAKIKKTLRFNILRWTPQEILKGEKKLRNGEHYTLEQAFNDPTLFKMDIIALVGGRFVDFSIIYDLRDKKNNRINIFRVDCEKSLREDIEYYKLIKDYSKMARRMYSLANYNITFKKKNIKNSVKTMKKLINIFDSGIGILYQVRSDIVVLLNILTEHKEKINIKQIDNEIDEFINRLSHIYKISSFPPYEKKILSLIRGALSTKSIKKKYKILEDVNNEITEILNKEIHKELIKNKLLK